MRALILFALLTSTPFVSAIVFDFAPEDIGGCQKLLNGPAYKTYPDVQSMHSAELNQIFSKRGVLAPTSSPNVLLSDRARARQRNLKAALPDLLNRRLIFRISEVDGHNSYLLGSVRSLIKNESGSDTTTTLTLEGLSMQDRTEEVIVSVASVTQLSGVNDDEVRDVKFRELEMVRAFRVEPAALLGRRVQVRSLSGILVAYAVPRRGQLQHLLQTGPGVFVWADAIESTGKLALLEVPQPW